MLTETHYLENLPPAQLDEYLSKGWFRMGQMIFTCHFLCLEGGLYSPIWMRLSLKNHAFRKRTRKKMRRIEARFRIKVKPAQIDETKEQLYAIYKNRFSGSISETLKESLLDFSEKNIYQTYEVAVYDGEQLIAASFFDLGSNSVASILGMFHPDYAQYSLGFYTMLAEVKYAKEMGMKYYYPGYVVHQYPKFDYKLRIGAMDYFDSNSQKWLAYREMNANLLPATLLQNKLQKIQTLLTELNIEHQYLLYPLYDKVAGQEYQNAFMNSPCFVGCQYHYLNEQILAIEYDLAAKMYILRLYKRFDNLFFFFPFLVDDAYNLDNTCFDYLIREYTIVESETPEIVVNTLKNLKTHLLQRKSTKSKSKRPTSRAEQ